jgi:Uma2 family endonuclease
MAQPADAVVHLTVEEFYDYPNRDQPGELVRGELRLMPFPGARHGVVVMNTLAALLDFVRPRKLGQLLADVSCELTDLPRTVRAPDIVFIRATRLTADDLDARFVRVPPDLVVEVLSPSDRASHVEEKLDDYRRVGIPLIWVIDPERRTVMIIAEDAPLRWLRDGDTLDGGRVLTDFECAVSDLFTGTTGAE